MQACTYESYKIIYKYLSFYIFYKTSNVSSINFRTVTV